MKDVAIRKVDAEFSVDIELDCENPDFGFLQAYEMSKDIKKNIYRASGCCWEVEILDVSYVQDKIYTIKFRGDCTVFIDQLVNSAIE